MQSLLKNKIKNVIRKSLIKVFSRFEIVDPQIQPHEILKNLNDDYGHELTKVNGKPVDVNQAPLPWFTYPAIEFLSQLDLSEKSIFEWGAGNSSLFFAERAASIISVESDPTWHEYINQNLKVNQKLILSSEEKFAEMIEEFPNKYDVIVVDSIRRYSCAEKALNFLNEGGMIILDNSDWYPNTSSMLRNDGRLIEVDMHGFGPINDYSWTTSFYFDRTFNFCPMQGVQPHVSKSGIRQQGKDDFPSRGA